ncbi:MAG: alpha,alpha-trehalase TreF [Bacteroidota bacterium]
MYVIDIQRKSMKNWISFLFFLIVCNKNQAQEIYLPAPNELYGQLFIDVQMAHVFPDDKTFADCIAKMDPGIIINEYESADKSTLDLKQFVLDHFRLPTNPPAFNYIKQEKELSNHINSAWSILERESTGSYDPFGSLLEIPDSYFVPGGNFREIHYWDSYFTMLGLRENRQVEAIQFMVDNFAFTINQFGHIPIGHRTYFVSRTHPPFFAMMVEMLAELKGDFIYGKYLSAMEREYAYWMEGAKELKFGDANKRVVRLKDGTYLNRYWDDLDIPRAEYYSQDVAIVENCITSDLQNKKFESAFAEKRFSDSLRSILYRNIRAADCSGWNLSSRWFSDGENLNSIETTEILPVDLNAMIVNMESIIIKARKIQGVKNAEAGFYKRGGFNAFFWNEKLNYYTDFQFKKYKKKDLITAAGMFPFCFDIEDIKAQKIKMGKASIVLQKNVLKPGGIVSVARNSGQQWDAPNGSAPIQWMTVMGLDRCGQKDLAKDISLRWIKRNDMEFERTAKVLPMYNVEDLKFEAGSKNNQGLDGFGWTNGVYLAMKKKYGENK